MDAGLGESGEAMNTCATCGPTCMPLIKDLCVMCFAKANKGHMDDQARNNEIYLTLANGKFITPGSHGVNPKMRLPGRGRKFYAIRKRYG